MALVIQQEGSVFEELYDQLDKAMAEATSLRREAFEESQKRHKAETDLINAHRRVTTLESAYSKELKQRKKIEAELLREKQEFEEGQNQLEEAIKGFCDALHKLPTDHISDSEYISSPQDSDFEGCEERVKVVGLKMASTWKHLINFKKERHSNYLHVTAVESTYTEELKQRKEIEAELLREKQELEEGQNQLEEAIKRFCDELNKLLADHISDSEYISGSEDSDFEGCEERVKVVGLKMASTWKHLVNFKKERHNNYLQMTAVESAYTKELKERKEIEAELLREKQKLEEDRNQLEEAIKRFCDELNKLLADHISDSEYISSPEDSDFEGYEERVKVVGLKMASVWKHLVNFKKERHNNYLQMTTIESAYTEELKERKEIEAELLKEKRKLEEGRNQLEEVTKRFCDELNKLLADHISDSEYISNPEDSDFEGYEERVKVVGLKMASVWKHLVNFKKERHSNYLQVTEVENAYTEELKQRKKIEAKLLREKQELEEGQNQLEEVIKRFCDKLNKLLADHISDSKYISVPEDSYFEGCEERVKVVGLKMASVWKHLVNFKKERHSNYLQATALESAYTEELKERKEIEAQLLREKHELEEGQNQLEEAIKGFCDELNKLLTDHISDSEYISGPEDSNFQGCEERFKVVGLKMASVWKQLVNFKKERHKLQIKFDIALKLTEELVQNQTDPKCEDPEYFICPILQDVMKDPHVAADGFSYEAEAFREWIDTGHDTSPMTNLRLAHTNLVPNHTLRSGIQEWLQRQ